MCHTSVIMQYHARNWVTDFVVIPSDDLKVKVLMLGVQGWRGWRGVSGLEGVVLLQDH